MRRWRFPASAIVGLAVATVAHANTAVGEWATQGYSARVQIRACDHAPGRLCGTIVWLWEPSDKQGRPMTDTRNPDASRRAAPLVGLQMLSDFAPATRPQSWTGGTIYNPEDGRTYGATLTLRAPDLLEVEGCVLIVCSRQVWRKLPTSCHPASSDTPNRRH
jgi:Delta7-sterol 5-desaturase